MLELGGETPLEVCLRRRSEAGFDGMELGNKFPREPDALKQALGAVRHGLRVAAGIRPNCCARDADAEIAGPAARISTC